VTLDDRAAAFARTFPNRPASHLRLVLEGKQPVLYGRWLGGQNYRAKSTFYGAYPPGYLARVDALFPDVGGSSGPATLHAFSGSLPPLGESIRLDVNETLNPDVVGSVCEAPRLFAGQPPFLLVLADPPYSAADAAKYGYGMVDRRRAIAALAQVTLVGGHLVWLDCVWPQHSKREWVTVGRIAYTRSTNHRTRDITIFERVAP
jgi:hypothetical protein